MTMKSVRSVLTTVLVLWCLMCVVTAKNLDGVHRTKRTTKPEKSCDNARALLEYWNVTVPAPGQTKGAVCGGECCGDDAEALFRKQGQKDFASMLRHNSMTLQGLLSLTSSTLQKHVSELSRQSENKTLLLFSQVYKGMAVLSRDPIRTLYSDIRSYIHINGSQADFAATTVDIKGSVAQFFTDFFPLVYHHILLHNQAKKDFTLDYKTCLRKTIDTILPFGDIPKQLSQSLAKSLEATRLLLQAFKIGREVLNTTDRILIDENGKTNAECHSALLKMTYCPKCMGLPVHKPCQGYCLNVLRGCLTKYVAELDSPWNGYVEGIEGLVNAMKKNNADTGVNPDTVIRSLDNSISEAIMRAMEKGTEIDRKVKRNCGKARFSEKENPLILENTTPFPGMGGGTKPRLANPRVFAPLPETQLLHFLTSIAKTRGFYGNLADTLCQDDSFAEPKDQRCWNGERIAEYTKTVVDVGLDMQKYNPEVKPITNLQNVDPQVANLVDKLRRVHHMAMSSIGSTTVDPDYMQRDGVDGSGSGNGPDFETDSEDDMRGSGSGYGATNTHDATNVDLGWSGTSRKNHHPSPSPTPASAGSSLKSTPVLMTSLAVVLISRFLRHRCCYN